MANEAAAVREAVELASMVIEIAELPDGLVREAVRERLGRRPVQALAAQAALCGALGALAEQRVAAFLRDAGALHTAAELAERGKPLPPSAVGVTQGALLREAGIAAARLG